jgi:hypothetical protein
MIYSEQNYQLAAQQTVLIAQMIGLLGIFPMFLGVIGFIKGWRRAFQWTMGGIALLCFWGYVTFFPELYVMQSIGRKVQIIQVEK